MTAAPPPGHRHPPARALHPELALPPAAVRAPACSTVPSCPSTTRPWSRFSPRGAQPAQRGRLPLGVDGHAPPAGGRIPTGGAALAGLGGRLAALSLGLSAATTDASAGRTAAPAGAGVLGASLGSISPVLRHRSPDRAVVLVAVRGRDRGPDRRASPGPGGRLPRRRGLGLLLLGIVYSFWLSGWMLRVVTRAGRGADAAPPSWPSPRNACGSPGTCTTCSAAPSPRSR